MSSIVEKIGEQYSKKLPFVVYIKPDTTDVIGLFQTDNLLYTVRDYTEKGFIFVSFDKSRQVLIPESKAELISETWKVDGNIAKKIAPYYTDKESAIEREKFENLVYSAVEAINRNEFRKVVLSRKERIQTKGFDITVAFQKMFHLYPNAFKYVFYHPEIGVWMGASPEQLLKIDNNILETTSLAGTRTHTDDGAFAKWAEKDVLEQQYVTDFIKEGLEKTTNNLVFSEPYTYRAGNILHIKTDVKANLKEHCNIKDIVNTLHPTPAVCGLPKEEAMNFVFEYENYTRTFYSGFLGELNFDTKETQPSTYLYVNIRCMEIEQNTAYLYVGCGITKDSEPSKEWEESKNKLQTMNRVLQ